MASQIEKVDPVDSVFAAYPDDVRPKMLELRALALGCAGEAYIDKVKETLKWGEPSYTSKYGSTLRMDWKARSPNQLGIYFTCSTILVETIREIYGDLFRYEKNRAVLLDAGSSIPTQQVQHCMVLALSYHKRKHLPLLSLG